MQTINLKDAKAGFSSLVDDVMKGDFVTITRHGKPVAALVSIEAGELVRKALERKRPAFVDYLRTIPVNVFTRNKAPSRDVDL
jgi:prevent-host-death family protein